MPIVATMSILAACGSSKPTPVTAKPVAPPVHPVVCDDWHSGSSSFGSTRGSGVNCQKGARTDYVAGKGEVIGRVMECGVDRALDGAVVTLFNTHESFSARTDENGDFRVQAPSGVYWLHVNVGDVYVSRCVSIDAGAVSRVDVQFDTTKISRSR